MQPQRTVPIAWVIDDDDTVRELLCGLIASIRADVRAYRSAAEFLAAFVPSPCQCVVSDVRMPDINGLRLFAELKKRHGIMPPVIFVTAYADVSTAIDAIKDGAFDYVVKPVRGDEFVDKVQAAFAHSVEAHARGQLRATRQARLALLTPKEREVLRLVLRGGSSKDVAQALDASVRTVEHHRARIMEKLHVGSVVELMASFIDEPGL